MILGWKNLDAFKRHMEEMESFRRAHPHLTPERHRKTVRAVPAPLNNNHPRQTTHFYNLIEDTGKTIVFPIWDIELPKGSQN